VIVKGTFVQPTDVKAQFPDTSLTCSVAGVVPEAGLTLYQEAPPEMENASALPSLLFTVMSCCWVAAVRPTELDVTDSVGRANVGAANASAAERKRAVFLRVRAASMIVLGQSDNTTPIGEKRRVPL
jgi:hypothetical protein